MSVNPLQSGFATILEALSAAARRHWAWPSPETGFAHYLLYTINECNRDLAFASQDADEQPVHAPSIAALGYALASKTAVDRRDQWIAGVKRLQTKNAFPPDRQSFAYRPLELLGIALGIRECNLQSADTGHWMKGILQRTRKEHTSVWAASLQQAAELAVGISSGRAPLQADAQSLLDFCAIRWLEQISSQTVTEELDIRILEAAATIVWEPGDAAQAVLAFHILRASVRRSIVSQVETNWQLGRESKSAEALVLHICRRFHRMAQQLQDRYDNRDTLLITDEYDVQDLMHGILLIFFDDVRPETPTPNYAGNSSRTDFVLWRENVVVETKMTRKNLGQKEVANQLIQDRERYSADPRCKSLVCFVYDPGGFCENPEALESDLAREDGPRTRVVVYSTRK